MKKFLASALFVLLLCGAASADFVYTTVDGNLGHISVQSATSIDIASFDINPGLGSSPRVAAWNKGEETVAVFSGDKAVIYTSEKLSSSSTVTLTGVENIANLSVSDNTVYAASNAKGIVEFSLSGYTPTGRVYPPDEGSASAKDVLVWGGSVYGLFTFPSSGKVRLIDLDGFLKDSSKYNDVEVGDTAAALAGTSGRVGVACTDASDGLQSVSGSTLSSLASGDVYGSIVAVCGDNDGGLYFVGQAGDGTNTLYHWSSSTSAVTTTSFTGTGKAALAWDSSNALLAVAMEDGIRIVNKDGAVVSSFDSAQDLGGVPTCLAFLPRSSNRTEKNSSGGCGVLGGNVLLLLPCLALAGYGRLKRAKKANLG